MTYDELLAIVSRRERVIQDPFDALKSLANYAVEDNYGSQSQMLLLRLLEYRKDLEAFGEPIDTLVRQFGLFPYIQDVENLPLSGRLALEVHRPGLSANLDLPNTLVFHREQAAIYYALLNGTNVILSAPTSFGKSLIIDAIIASGRHRNIVVVLPTLALVDETRRRFTKFKDHYKLITHGSQRPGERNIYVLTQERVIEMSSGMDVEFFVIDEFYKLSPRTDGDDDDSRSHLLNHAFYLLHQRGAQFYLLGPNIHALTRETELGLRDYKFIKTEYSTVVTEVITVPPGGTDEERLKALAKSLDEPTIVYCKGPGRAARIALLLADAVGFQIPEAAPACDWIGKEYHPDWSFIKALRKGIGLHHGHIPRALAQYVVRQFNDEVLRFLVCTSTLIEGVNTKAKNILILDDHVGNQRLDFFTFNNIRGRSGRMFMHFVGRVYLFHPEPERILPMVDVPALSQGDVVPTSLLIQMDAQDLSEDSRRRLLDYENQDSISIDALKANVGISLDLQIALAAEIKTNPDLYHKYLNWTLQPEYDQLVAVCTLLNTYPLGGRQLVGVSPQAQASVLRKLQQRSSLNTLIESQVRFHDGDAEAAVSAVLRFLKEFAMFSFPKAIRALDVIQREIFTSLGRIAGNFEAYARQVENLFHDGRLVALEEYGIPLPLAVKFASRLPRGDQLDDVLDWLRRTEPDTITQNDFELSLLADAREGL